MAVLILVPVFTALAGILISVMLTPFFIARYLIPCMGITALFLAVRLGGMLHSRATIVLLGIFLTVMIGNSYYTNYLSEYRSTHTDEFLRYMDENRTPDDIILYNNQEYGFIYECYFGSDKLRFMDNMDFSSQFDRIWYLDSCVSPWLSDVTLEKHGLVKKYIATLGIEQNDFILYKICKKP